MNAFIASSRRQQSPFNAATWKRDAQRLHAPVAWLEAPNIRFKVMRGSVRHAEGTKSLILLDIASFGAAAQKRCRLGQQKICALLEIGSRLRNDRCVKELKSVSVNAVLCLRVTETQKRRRKRVFRWGLMRRASTKTRG